MNRYQPANVSKPQLELNPRLRIAVNNMVNDYTTKTHQPPCEVHDLSIDEITYLQAYLEQVKIQQMSKIISQPNIKKCIITVNDLYPDEITYLQTYLEQIKVKEIGKMAVQPNTKRCITIGDGKPITECRIPQAVNRMTDIYNPNSDTNPMPGHRGGMATRSGRKTTNEESVEHFKPCLDSNAYYNPYEVGARQNEFGSLYKPTYTGPYNVKPDLLADIGLDNRMYWEKFPGDVRNVNVESLLYQGEMTHIPGQRELTETEINRFELLPFDPQDTRHIIWKDNMPRGGYPTRVDRLETL